MCWLRGTRFRSRSERKGFEGIAEELVAIHWGARTYLVPSEEIVAFCNDVNGGLEPRDGPQGRHFLRRGDEQKEVGGFPDVPRSYRGYLLDKPIEATIVAVGSYTTRRSLGEWKFKDTQVTLDKGMNAGLLPGMEVHVVGSNALVESITITTVQEATAEGIMTDFGEEEPGPKVGWKLSTRLSWMTDKRERTTER